MRAIEQDVVWPDLEDDPRVTCPHPPEDGCSEYNSCDERRELINAPGLIPTFGQHFNGELYYTTLDGRIYRIDAGTSGGGGVVPELLSGTGCVDPADPTQPSSAMIPYDLNAPFWSDGAVKQRWMALPNGETIDLDSDGDFDFPNGSVLMKSFTVGGQLTETRLLLRHDDGVWAGYTYEWNGAGTDANRVVGGKVADKFGQDWIYPSGSDCMQCHTQAANFSVGIEHGQLNKGLTYPSTGITANQLVTADAVDLLTAPQTNHKLAACSKSSKIGIGLGNLLHSGGLGTAGKGILAVLLVKACH